MISFHFLGHAGVRISSQGQSLVIDPWFGHPFSGGNLVPYPPIAAPPPTALADTAALHISHIHQDHFCGQSLALFPRDTPVLLGRYPQPGLADATRRLGFTQVLEIPDDGLAIGPFRLHHVPLEPFDGSFDSLLIVAVEGRTILLNNDCLLSEARYLALRRRFGRIDHGFVGYSLVSPYPVCYDIQQADAGALLAANQQFSIDHLVQLDRIFEFERLIPYANGLRLLCPSTLPMNRAFNRLDTLADGLPPALARKLYLVQPGQQWDEQFAEQPLQHAYGPEAIAAHFQDAGVRHQHRFANTALLPEAQYLAFFAAYFRAAERKRGFEVDIVCCITDDSFLPLKTFRWAGGQCRLAPQDMPLEDMICLELPCAWLNEVVLGRMPMGALYYAFQFRARYPGRAVPFARRVHRW